MAETAPPAIEAEAAQGPGFADDHDSLYDEQLTQYTQSLTDSVLNYPVEHGRRYHAFRSGVYCLPNDEPELDRLDLTHVLMVKAIGNKSYLAPIDPNHVHRILDIGTGTGIWAMSIGDEMPNATVLGNDLSPVQPPWVPPNVQFEIDDVEAQWLHSIPFDWIFCRYMATSIADWPKLFRSVFKHLNPGGWAEFQDFDLQYYSEDGTLKEDSDTLIWINTLLEAARKINRDPCPGVGLEGWAHEAGFEDIVHQRFKMPIGTWPRDHAMKELGAFNLAQVLQGLEGFSLRLFCDVLGWQQEEVLVLTSKVRKELKSGNVHALFDFHVVYGRKPGKKGNEPAPLVEPPAPEPTSAAPAAAPAEASAPAVHTEASTTAQPQSMAPGPVQEVEQNIITAKEESEAPAAAAAEPAKPEEAKPAEPAASGS